jgi:hypothetical protein
MCSEVQAMAPINFQDLKSGIPNLHNGPQWTFTGKAST